jgi:PPP family 3-phenylpropionic acid transporter
MPNNPHRARRTPLLPLALAFAAANLVAGLVYPLIPVVLTERGGLTPREFGLFFALASIAGGTAFPLWGLVADGRLGRPRTLAIALGLLGSLGAVAFVGPIALVPLAIFCFLIAESALAPVLDALALDALHGRTALYGRLRSAGSGGYALAAIGASPLILLGGEIAHAIAIAAAALIGLVAALRLPRRRIEPASRPHLRDLVALPRRAPVFGRFLLIALLAALPLAAFLTWFGPLLRLRGFEPGLAAAAAGGTALFEIPALLLASRLGERYGWRSLLIAGAALYAVPLALVALPLGLPLPLLLAARISSGIPFALLMTGAVVMVRELAPKELVATGQGLLQLVVFGGAPAIASLIGGFFWAEVGALSLLTLAVAGPVAALWAWRCLPARSRIHHTANDRGVEPAVFEPPA